ncbi:NAD(P)/FAD-dependent oxidoreductase [Rhodococcus sp. NPDC055024]
MPQTCAIVGASLAGSEAAWELRERGFEGRVLLVGEEVHGPYDRPPLSKDFLTGTDIIAPPSIRSSSQLQERGIEMITATRVVALRPSEGAIELDNGSTITADKVLLATGSVPRRLPVAGADLPGVHTLRTYDDALALRSGLKAGSQVVVVGAGFIGLEVAASAVQLGCDVTVLESAGQILGRVFGPEVSDTYVDLHRAHGVTIRVESTARAIIGSTHCTAVELNDGTTIGADVVVVGIGVDPAIDLARSAALTVANGILVDHSCATSNESVFAAGDCSSRPTAHAPEPVRLESWHNAVRQGAAAARSMLGEQVHFDELPWMWSDQYDVNMQIIGLPRRDQQLVWRGHPYSTKRIGFFMEGMRVRAAICLNQGRERRPVSGLIVSSVELDPAALADLDTPLRSLAKATV